MLTSILRGVGDLVLFMGLMLVFALAAGFSVAVVAAGALLIQGHPDLALLSGLVAMLLFGAIAGTMRLISYGTDRLYP